MIHQYFVDLASNQDNYNEILSFCKHFINPVGPPTFTRILGNGSNGKSTLVSILEHLTTAEVIFIDINRFDEHYLNNLDLSKSTILVMVEEQTLFFQPNVKLIEKLSNYNNLHIVYLANTAEPLGTLNTIVKTLYLMQHINDAMMFIKLMQHTQALREYINTI